MPIFLRPGYYQAKNRRKPDLNWNLETGNLKLKPLLCGVPMQSGTKQTLVVTGNLGRTETGNWKFEIETPTLRGSDAIGNDANSCSNRELGKNGIWKLEI